MKFLLIALFVAPAFGLIIKDPSWHVWKQTHSKSYADEGEERVRYVIWQENFKKIIEFNEKNKDMTLAMNHLGDLVSLLCLKEIQPFHLTD